MSERSIEIALSPTSTVGLITTTQCTAACEDCCFGCNQKNHESMNSDTIIKAIDMASKALPELKMIVLTGGECFLLGEDILINVSNRNIINNQIISI